LLTPAQRSMRARLAAYALHSQRDPRETTAAARAANPSSLAYWRTKVDPDRLLAEVERDRRAEAARRGHFARLALKSSQARAARKAAS
jgi:hypothetical protein